MSALDQLLEKHRSSSVIPMARLVAGLIFLFLVWAFYAELDEVTVANGIVIPKSKVKLIQHYEGGIIKDIFIAESQRVETGDPLLQLDLAVGGINLDELQVKLDGLLLTRIRLEAEATSADELILPPQLTDKRPLLAEAEKANYTSGQQEREAAYAVLKDQIQQRKEAIKELEAQREATLKNRDLANQQFSMSQELRQSGLTSKLDHLRVQADLEKIEGDLSVIEARLPRINAALNESQRHLEEEELKFQRQTREHLGRIEREIASTREQLNRASEQEGRAIIRSPIPGVVKNLRFNTVGGVVQPGESIMEVVPSSGKLVIEASLKPEDRGHVRVGDAAVVKISTYDFIRYGGLDGQVTDIAADSSRDPEGNLFYRLEVKTERDYLGGDAGALPITPGMVATIDIHTGSKTVLEYLINPVLKLRYEAFRER